MNKAGGITSESGRKSRNFSVADNVASNKFLVIIVTTLCQPDIGEVAMSVFPSSIAKKWLLEARNAIVDSNTSILLCVMIKIEDILKFSPCFHRERVIGTK